MTNEQNLQQNGGSQGGNDGNSSVQPDAANLSGNSGDGRGSGSSNTSRNQGVFSAPKKPKTEQQKAREKERRRRRRRKKSGLQPGQDVPLILSEKVLKNQPLEAPKDVKVQENKEEAELVQRKLEEAGKEELSQISVTEDDLLPKIEPAAVVDDEQKADLIVEKELDVEKTPVDLTEAVANSEPARNPFSYSSSSWNTSVSPVPPANAQEEDLDIDQPIGSVGGAAIEKVEVEEPADEKLEMEEPAYPAAPVGYMGDRSLDQPVLEPETEDLPEQPVLDESQKIFEESPSYGSASYDEPVNEPLAQSNDRLANDGLEVNYLAPKNQEFNQNAGDDDIYRSALEPHPEENFEEESPADQTRESIVEPEDADVLSEDDLQKEKIDQAKQIMDDLHGEDDGEGLAEVQEKSWIIGGILRTVLGVVAVIALAVGAFWLGSSLHLMDLVKNVIWPTPSIELAQGDNSKVIIDEQMLKSWGFSTAKLFGQNLGDKRDLVYNTFFVASYFGKLHDPIFYGETGITAALYYGFGLEAQYFANKFIYYVKYLGQIRQANLVDVQDVLNGKLKRDLALDDYISKLQGVFDQGNILRKEINVQIDDLNVSINSLNPDHDRYQTDFFSSVEQIQGEKANELILKFIETSQKQVELRAKLGALTRLSSDYTADLLKMKLRIEGLQKNRDALIKGVTVTPVTGSGINLVNQ